MTSLVAVDLDGTLITADGGGVAEARMAFAPLRAAGVGITIATGRMAESAAQILAEMGVESAHIIALNGAEIWRYPMAGRPLRRCTIPARVAAAVRDACIAAGAEVQGYVRGELRVVARTERTERYAERTRLTPVVGPAETLTDRPQKLLALIERARRDALMQELLEEYSGRVDAYGSEPDFIEIVPPGVDKGEALAWLCRRLHLPISSVFAAGDAENDLGMLRLTPNSFAPVSAVARVREVANTLLPPPPGLVGALADAVLR